METSQHFSNDSFSTGWLININSSLDLKNESHRSIDTQDFSSLIDMDTEFFSMRWISDTNDFGFSIPRSKTSGLVHADQIISNGHLVPLDVAGAPICECTSFGSEVCSRSQSVNSSASMLSRSGRHDQKYYFNALSSRVNSETSSPAFYSSHSTPCSSKSLFSKSESFNSPVMIRNCVKSPKKIFCRYLRFLMPLCKKVGGFRLRTLQLSKNCRKSAQNSLRTNSNAFSSIEWCRSNADISIYDAILHCKRSNEQEKL